MTLDRRYAIASWLAWRGVRAWARRGRARRGMAEPQRAHRRWPWLVALAGVAVAGVAWYRRRAIAQAPPAYDGPLPPPAPGTATAPGEEPPPPS